MKLLSREFSPQSFVQSITSTVNGNNLYPPPSETRNVTAPHIINIHCSAESLPHSSILSKADPLLVMFTKTKRGWKEYGRTEVCYNIFNPVWVRPFTYRIKYINSNNEKENNNENERNNKKYNNHETEILKDDFIAFKIFDIDENSIELIHHKCIGFCEVNVRDILQSPTRSLKVELRAQPTASKKANSNSNTNINSNTKSSTSPSPNPSPKSSQQTNKNANKLCGYLNIYFFELVSGVHGSLFFRMSVNHIKSPVRKILKANPFFVISRFHVGSHTFVPVYKSSVRSRKKKVDWDNIEIFLQFVCGGDFNLPIRITFHDYKSHGFKLIGAVSTTIGALVARKENTFEIVMIKNKNKEVVYELNRDEMNDSTLSLLKENVNGIFITSIIENRDNNKTLSNFSSTNNIINVRFDDNSINNKQDQNNNSNNNNNINENNVNENNVNENNVNENNVNENNVNENNVNENNVKKNNVNENNVNENNRYGNNSVANLGLMPRLFDYRLIGVQLSAMIGIDFSSSVVTFTFNNRGNHLENGFFSYRYAINDVCDLLTPVVMGQPISAYAFADFPSILHKSHNLQDFSSLHNENNEYENRIRSIALNKQTDLIPDTITLIRCYEHAKDTTIKHFPQKCYLTPLLKKARDVSRKKWTETRSVTILVVVTNGAFEDLNNAIDLFVECEKNKEPFVTIILCMGGKRKELDNVFKHHHGVITDSLGKKTTRRTVKMTTYLEYKVYPDPRLPEKMEPCAKKMAREWLESIEYCKNAPSFQVIENM